MFGEFMERQISDWPACKRVVLAASAAQRLLPHWVAFCESSGSDATLFTGLLDSLWTAASEHPQAIAEVMANDLSRIGNVLEAIPHEDETESVGMVYATYAAAAVYFALDCINNAESAVHGSMRAYDAAYYRVDRMLFPGKSDAALISKHPLMKSEMAKQNDDFVSVSIANVEDKREWQQCVKRIRTSSLMLAAEYWRPA
jgi:uncharacterized protein YjaG (DUF416 family)